MDRVDGAAAATAESSVVVHAQMTLLVGAECCCREGGREGGREGRKEGQIIISGDDISN